MRRVGRAEGRRWRGSGSERGLAVGFAQEASWTVPSWSAQLAKVTIGTVLFSPQANARSMLPAFASVALDHQRGRHFVGILATNTPRNTFGPIISLVVIHVLFLHIPFLLLDLFPLGELRLCLSLSRGRSCPSPSRTPLPSVSILFNSFFDRFLDNERLFNDVTTLAVSSPRLASRRRSGRRS